MGILLAQIIVLLALPFIYLWLILRIKAFWAARRGPVMLQPLRDTLRLLKKGAVYSATTTTVFRVMPTIQLAAIMTAAVLIPMSGNAHPVSFSGDFVVFAYLLAASRFALIAGALETGSPFEGMGASREASFAVFAEPAFFTLMGTMVLLAGQSDFVNMIFAVEQNAVFVTLATLSLFIMLLLEGARVPVDDPATHLELTMIHEAMILDHSGPDLAILHYGAGLKMVVISSLIVLLLIPTRVMTEVLGQWGGLVATTMGTLVIACLIGTLESFMARLRLTHVPQFVLLMFSMALITLVSALLLS